MSHSIDIRERTLKFVQDGGSQLEASRIFGVDRKTIYTWLRRETLAPQKPKGRPPRFDCNILNQHVILYPDQLLRERAAEFGVTPSGMWRALCRLGIVKKKRRGILRVIT